VVPAADVLTESIALAEQIAANGPLAVRLSKQLAYANEDASAKDIWAQIDTVTTTVMGSDDAKEGARAFVEKRAPSWTGR
jgi:enoyl-CoA hydratase